MKPTTALKVGKSSKGGATFKSPNCLVPPGMNDSYGGKGGTKNHGGSSKEAKVT